MLKRDLSSESAHDTRNREQEVPGIETIVTAARDQILVAFAAMFSRTAALSL